MNKIVLLLLVLFIFFVQTNSISNYLFEFLWHFLVVSLKNMHVASIKYWIELFTLNASTREKRGTDRDKFTATHWQNSYEKEKIEMNVRCVSREFREKHERDAVPPCARGDTMQTRSKNGSNSQVEKYAEFEMKLDGSIPMRHSRLYVLGWSCFWQTEIPVPKERRNVSTLKFSTYDTERNLPIQIASPQLFVDFQFSPENDNSNKLKQFTVNVSANVCDSLTFVKLQNFLL